MTPTRPLVRRRLGARLRSFVIGLTLALIFAAGLPGAAWAQAVAYSPAIQGVPEDNLRALLKESSRLFALKDDPPATLAGLRRRARSDVARLRKALRSEGFYAAEVDAEVRTAENAEDEDDAARAVLKVETGPVYVLAEAAIAYTRPIPEAVPVPRQAEDLDLAVGMTARAPRILAAQRRLLDRLANQGYPEATVAERRAVVDHANTTLSLTWRVDAGPRLDFGPMQVEGLESVARDYLSRFREWAPGTPYNQAQVEATRKALADTGLFQRVRVRRGTPRSGRVPVIFEVSEREHRSVGFAARFATSEGPSGTAFWEHRNWLGSNEKLRGELDVGLIAQQLTGRFTKPRFRRPDQRLNSSLSLRRQDSDAFDERALSSTLDVARDLSESTTASLGASLEFTQTDDAEGEQTFILAGAPAHLTRDTRDDVLNPARGTLLDLRTTPYLFTIEESKAFLRNEVSGRAYLALDSADRFVLAGRTRVGSILGPDTQDIPASKRFFAGGGGSIRGFDFQEVGPLDDDNDPLGGKSVLEASVELRARVTESFGIVPFFDGGNVYDGPLLALSDDPGAELRFAGGLGLRYFTAIGPIRLDVARAFDRRDVDDSFELYISLGQAF